MNVRGACPSVSEPMQTGDGLLARLIVHEPISIERLCALCEAAQELGNGIMEVTQRGNLQIRGLSDLTAPTFADRVARLELGVEQIPPILTSALLGLEASEPSDSGSTALVSSLLVAFHQARSELQHLGPKVTVLVDGGGRLHLDSLRADVRLVAMGRSQFQLSLGGAVNNATPLGRVTANSAAETVVALLRRLARIGPGARVRTDTDLDADTLAAIARGAVPPTQATRDAASTTRPPADPVGTYELKDGTRALGFALPFGHTTATSLRQVARTAIAHGATAIRPAPGRALLAIGLPASATSSLRESLAAAGYIVSQGDPRRQVFACVGSPSCASAQLPTRQLAPQVALAIQPWAGTSTTIHLTGCSKGCAHPGPATVTFVGPDRVILNGRAGDPHHTTLSAAGLIADIQRLCTDLQ